MEIKDKISYVGGLLDTAAYVPMKAPAGTVSYLDVESKGKTEKILPGELPMEVISLGVKTKVVEAETYVCSAKIPQELFVDMSALHGINPLAETERVLYNEMNAEIQIRLYNMYKKLGESSAASQKSGWTKWVEKLFKTSFPTYTLSLTTHIAKRANQIAHKTRRGPANFAIVNHAMLMELEKSNAFEFADISVSQSNQGFDRVGYISGIVIYVNRYQSVFDNTIIIGRMTNAKTHDPGIYFCEYTNEFISVEDSIMRETKVQLRSRHACVEVGKNVSDSYITENILIGKEPWWKKLFRI